MRISILALGSRGDILPYTWLGRGLRKAGYQVRLVSFEDFAPAVAESGLDFHPVDGSAQAIMGSNAGVDLAGSGRNIVKSMAAIMRSFGAQQAAYERAFSDPILHNSDLIINQLPGCLYGYDLADALDIPLMVASVIPLTRTREFPMLAFPRRFAGLPGYNALTYRLAEQMLWRLFYPSINRWRKRDLGLGKANWSGYFDQLGTPKVPILNGFSSQIVPRPGDWGRSVHQCGYWFPDSEDWEPPDDLSAYLEQGDPPVFVGFGSMPVRDIDAMVATLQQALNACGRRAVVGAGWSGLSEGKRSDRVFVIQYAPYEWLFPRMAALVHHGGSGTTAFGVRSGIPALVTPFLFDQFYWGERLAALGIAPRPIPYKRISAKNLAAALEQMLGDREMRKKAGQMGVRIQAEDGISEAVRFIQTFI
jgi:UDP:flavonoid glycosyltransferase YjiC (YdhE family)